MAQAGQVAMLEAWLALNGLVKLFSVRRILLTQSHRNTSHLSIGFWVLLRLIFCFCFNFLLKYDYVCEFHSILLHIVVDCSFSLQYSILLCNLYHLSFIHSTRNGNLDAFWFGPIANGAVKDILIYAFLCSNACISVGYITKWNSWVIRRHILNLERY